MAQILTTASVAAHERHAYWADAICDAYVQLEFDALAPDSQTEGEIRIDSLSTLQLSRVTATAQHVRRTPAKIARSSEDFFLVSIQTLGQGVVVQDGRAASLAPGDFALYDSTRPYELVFEGDFQQYVLMLPGATLRSELRDTQRLTASTVSGTRGAGHLMINMIRTLAQDIQALEPESAAAVAASVTNILIAGLRALPGAPHSSMSNLVSFHLEQIKAYVRQHLDEPGLCVGQIARELRMSTSNVHRVFAGEACSVSDWIWALRLDRVQRDLCDPGLLGKSVSQLAFARGFNDAAHFSRAFRARFGCSPREFRARQIGAPGPRT
jgi:AraC-like DNA-binding protein